MTSAGAPAEWPAGQAVRLARRRLWRPSMPVHDTCQPQRRASSTRSVGRRRCALWYTMIAGYSACTAACSAGGQLDQRSSLPSLPRTGAGRPVGASEPPRRSGVRAGFPVRTRTRLSGRLVGCSGWSAAACWASALAGRWRVNTGWRRGASDLTARARRPTPGSTRPSRRTPAPGRRRRREWPPRRRSRSEPSRSAVLAARLRGRWLATLLRGH